jgi:hypothetical protein
MFYGPEESLNLRETLEKKAETAISQTESDAIKAQMQAIDKFFQARIEATFKIEVQFGKDRSTWKPCVGMMSIFLSGTKLHGGGDEKLYMCPKEGCDGIIYPNERLGAQVVCRKCNMFWPENDLIGELMFKLTAQNWAKVLEKWFNRLEGKCDIYLKYHPTDIRYAAAQEQLRQKGGDLLNKARNNRGLHIYPMRNIIKDTSNGSAVYDRFLAFVRA